MNDPLSGFWYTTLYLYWSSYWKTGNQTVFPSHRIDTVHITTDVIISTVLTHFKPMFHFYTPGKHQKIGGFLIFSGGREDFSNKNFLCVVSNLTNTLYFKSVWKKGIPSTQISGSSLVQLNSVFRNDQIHKNEDAICLHHNSFFKDISRAGKIRFFGARKSVLLKASSGEHCAPQNFVHLATFRGTRVHLIVYLVVHQIKYLMERWSSTIKSCNFLT